MLGTAFHFVPMTDPPFRALVMEDGRQPKVDVEERHER